MGDSSFYFDHGGPWRELAACRGLDPALFFPARGEGNGRDPARLVCDSCVVRDPCLAAARPGLDNEGTWGGLSAKQRRLRRRALASASDTGTATNGPENGAGGPQKVQEGGPGEPADPRFLGLTPQEAP